ncbi:MAG: pyrroline-5-carboxylate reductase [SAR202 cluster bacterium]|nr:pyrroline-5-carboxylate reductase [SAR202 cluster bacterium]
MKLAFIGGGAMAEAIIKGALSASMAKPEEITVGEVVEERCRYLANQYRILATPSNAKAVRSADLVILAVKPQSLNDVAADLKPSLKPNHTVLSILAGTRMAALTKGLGHNGVIRVMPNTPAQIGAGMSVWMTSPGVDEKVAKEAQAILKTLGEEIRVHNEKYIDMATALSASGPAFIFLFIESLIDSGVLIGLPRPMARTLALQTVLGSARLVKETGKHPAELTDMVTSPGGTTVAGLLALEDASFKAAVLNAVQAAYQKSIALGEN